MDIEVRVFLGDELIDGERLARLTICNTSVDRIVNSIADGGTAMSGTNGKADGEHTINLPSALELSSET